MFWADKLVSDIKNKFSVNIANQSRLVIRDEKTMSGRVHIGSLRGVIVHGIINEILEEQGIKSDFLYEINDFDVMDGLPVYLDRDKYMPFMGRLLKDVPCPGDKADNYAEYFAQEFISVINLLGFNIEYYRSSEKYISGFYNNAIIVALEKADRIRDIYKRISGSVKPPNWLPIGIVCEKCHKIGTTEAYKFDGQEVEYTCKKAQVSWAQGCEYRGKISPLNGNAKLPWKVEWAAKFFLFHVHVEGAGKDHSTKGGSRDVSNAISKEIYNYEPPYDIPYEHILVDGQKMSSSKGAGASCIEISRLLPPQLIRLLFLNKDYKQAVNFAPHGDTIPVLYDLYDRLRERYFEDIDDDYRRVFYWSHIPQFRDNLKNCFYPRFSQVAFLTQMPHVDLGEEIEQMKGEKLNELDKQELVDREKHARVWLEGYAPEEYKFTLFEDDIPERAFDLTDAQKLALARVLQYIKSEKELEGQSLHTKLHEIRKQEGLEPKIFFGALYITFLGKDYGPKVGWFLSVLDKEFLEKRLAEVIE
jgi:lysyl-tRNA synthetase, class I